MMNSTANKQIKHPLVSHFMIIITIQNSPSVHLQAFVNCDNDHKMAH